ncbi:TetR/AcrR family transcriptional regulator [Pseudonocardia acaciae]|uniref:TetR/AcrR family transcriptional regulator n=1 Tax=Pseudonocardia acaciae TaxID=551276 RepID=UPI000490FF1C|nr:TetR/AcrR family transcriptional regulator [Pseudonocardia acaciae]
MDDRSPKARDSALVSRDRLYIGALEAFAERGFHGASMRDIASRSGMALGNLYNHTSSKAELLVQLLKRATYDHLADTEWAVSAAGPDPRDQFVAAVRAYVRFILDRPLESMIAHSEVRYLGEDDRKRLVIARDRLEAIFGNIVHEGVRTGVFTTPHPDEVTKAVLPMCSGIANWYRPDGPLSKDEVCERFATYAAAVVQPVARSAS